MKRLSLFVILFSFIVIGCKDNSLNYEIHFPIQVQTWQLESHDDGVWLGTSSSSETNSDTVIIRNTEQHDFTVEKTSNGVDLTLIDRTITEQDTVTSYAIQNLDDSNLTINGDAAQFSESDMRITWSMSYDCQKETPIKLGEIILSLHNGDNEIKVYKFEAPGFEHIISILAC